MRKFNSIVELIDRVALVILGHHACITKNEDPGCIWSLERETLNRAAKLVVCASGSFHGPIDQLSAEGMRNVVDSIVSPHGPEPEDFWSNGVGTMVFNLTEAVFEQ